MPDEADDLHKDIEAQRVGLVEEVEDSGERIGGEGEAVGGRAGDGLEKVAAEGGQVLLGLLGLEDEVDEEVVGGGEVLLGGAVEGVGGLDNNIKSILALVLLEERLDLLADGDEVGHLLRQLGEGAVDEDQLGGSHVDRSMYVWLLLTGGSVELFPVGPYSKAE